MNRRTVALVWLLSALLCCLPARALSAGTPAAPAKQVLLLNSYHPGYAWNIPLLLGMHQVLDRADIPLRIRYEYMDAKHYATDAFVDELRGLYRQKYRHMRFDAIIASDNDAFHFLRRYRDELFPGAAVIFCGVNGFDPHWMEGFSKATGTEEHFDLSGTIALALKLHPKARHVVLVGGVDTTSRTNVAMVRQIMLRLFPHITLLDYSGLNVDVLERRLHDAPRDAVLLYISYYLTPDGTRIPVQESIAMVSRMSGLPMYTAWSYLLSDGMVGGKMLRAEDQGVTAAQMALRVLHGEDPDQMPVIRQSPTHYMFDAARLEYFGIPRNELPPDSILLNDHIDLLERYRTVIIGALLFMTYQAGVIVWLLLNMQRRKRAEAQLRRDQALRAQLEEQLFHAQKLEAIDTFAGGIAHDFNNILESMSACCELAMEDVSPDTAARDDLRQALASARRGKALIRRLLDFSRHAPSRMARLDLSALITENLDMVRPLLPPGVELSARIQPALAVRGDADKLTQVFINLCVNAGQAMNPALQAEKERRPAALTVELAATSTPGMVRLTVSDTGHGIPPDLLPRIFDPFFTTRPKGVGTGLGLAVTHGIVRQHEGQIQVASTPGQGATFTVLLPQAPASPAPAAVPGGHETLLLADDDDAVARPLSRRLARLGYTVLVASSAAEALAQPAADLVITDYNMPDMNGVELGRHFACPVILITGLPHDAIPDSRSLGQAGIDALIHKPVDFPQLANMVRHLLDGGTPQRSASTEQPRPTV